MPEKSAADKTEQPTPRRIRKAREKGQVPQSEEFSSVVTLAVLLGSLVFVAPKLLAWSTSEMADGFSLHQGVFADSQSFMNFLNAKFINIIIVISPVLAAITAASIAASVFVSGPNFSGKALEFKLNSINPVSGFGKLFNVKSLVKLILSIFKLAFIGAVIWFYLHGKIDELAALRWAWSTQIIVTISKLILGMMIRICLALLVIGLADLAWQKWKYIEDLKMSKQEVKDERKETEGAPEIKGRIRRMQYEIALKRVAQEVPKASVVLVNPTHFAVAIRYDAKTMDSPVLVAKGADFMAEKIREIARAYGIPILRRPELTRTIYKALQPGQTIPQELYVAVAEILALIYRLKRNRA
ncbi:MAG: flagellar biosynthesis protein FlhB [Phycisphaerae bacterium]|jgi:flagellar biosynthetic protein FlhB